MKRPVLAEMTYVPRRWIMVAFAPFSWKIWVACANNYNIFARSITRKRSVLMLATVIDSTLEIMLAGEFQHFGLAGATLLVG